MSYTPWSVSNVLRRRDIEEVFMWESGRTGFDRGWEHLNACRRQDQESPLVEHAEKWHEGAIPRFKMEITIYPKSNLARQALEASQIQVNGCQNLLNRKVE